MKVIEPGHVYQLNILDGVSPDWLFFVKRVGPGYPGNEGNPRSVTNCQEVLRVLIDRVKYLDKQIPSEWNLAIIENLRNSLYQFEARAAERHGRTLRWLDLQDEIELEPTCVHCGHIRCPGDCHALQVSTRGAGDPASTS